LKSLFRSCRPTSFFQNNEAQQIINNG